MRPAAQLQSRLFAVLILLLPLGLVAAPTLVSAQTAPQTGPQTGPKSDAAQTARIELPPGVERVVTVEGITEYRLQNGLRVLLFPDATKQVVSVNITYMVGSRHESYGETGMAHLLEHMLFKGTPRHGNIWKELRDRGASANATTHYDRTNYYAVLSATDENLEWVLELEADRMVNSFVAKKDLDSEMTVVRNEMEGKENNPGAVLSERVMATAFEWHSYGKAVLGARADVENVPIERLQAFYKTFYRPDNAVLIVAGKVSEQKALALVQKHFGPIPKPEKALPLHYTVEPAQDGERLVTVRRVGDYQLAIAGYHVPPASHPDFAAVAVAVNILGAYALRQVAQETGGDEEGQVVLRQLSRPQGRQLPLLQRGAEQGGPACRGARCAGEDRGGPRLGPAVAGRGRARPRSLREQLRGQSQGARAHERRS